MNKYLTEAQERAKQIWRTEGEQEAFISGVQWLIMQPEIVKLLDLHIVTHSAYQLCPKCNGQGIVSKPPWVAGDVEQWTSSAASYICDLCNGAKVIPQHCG